MNLRSKAVSSVAIFKVSFKPVQNLSRDMELIITIVIGRTVVISVVLIESQRQSVVKEIYSQGRNLECISRKSKALRSCGVNTPANPPL